MTCRNHLKKAKVILCLYLEAVHERSTEEMLSKETSLLAKHLGKDQPLHNSRYVSFNSSYLVHCPSCITGMQMQKKNIV